METNGGFYEHKRSEGLGCNFLFFQGHLCKLVGTSVPFVRV